MKELQTILKMNNSYVKELKNAYERENRRNCSISEMKILVKDSFIQWSSETADNCLGITINKGKINVFNH